MSNLFGRAKHTTNLGNYGPVWIGTSWYGAAGADLSLVCPVPFRLYRLLGLVADINVTTLGSATDTFTVKGLNISDGTANTTVFTGTTPALPINAVGHNIIKMFSARIPEYSAINGRIVAIEGSAGTQFTTTSAATLGGTGTTTAVSVNNETAVPATHRGVLPWFAATSNLTLTVSQVNVNWLVEPIGKM